MSSNKSQGNASDVYLKYVHASCQSMGHSGFYKFTGLMDLPKPVNVRPYAERDAQS